MLNAKAALAALWCCVVFVLPVQATSSPSTLDLDQAYALTVAQHPELRRLPLRQAALSAELAQSQQPPPLQLSLTLENVLGSGAYSGGQEAEATLALGSLREPAEKRLARQAVAQSRLDGLDPEAEASRLDLMAEVARRYLDALAAQGEVEALGLSLAQREATVAAADRRVRAGASPLSVRLGAEANLARAALELARAQEQARATRQHLALLWGPDEPDFDRVSGDLLALPRTPDFATLAALLEATPALQRFASEARLREARLQLAQAQARPDLEWQVGLRRLQGSQDMALMGGVSLPLGSRRRAEPAIRSARAELDELALEREAGRLDLQATLAQAHGRLRLESLTVAQSGERVLPALERAERAAGDAYRAGALSHLEWSQLQADLLAARRERIAAAREFHRALIEIQRLTAEPFVLAAGATEEYTP